MADLPGSFVIPAKAGIHNGNAVPHWTPACAGVTKIGAGVTMKDTGFLNMGNSRG